MAPLIEHYINEYKRFSWGLSITTSILGAYSLTMYFTKDLVKEAKRKLACHDDHAHDNGGVC